MNPFGLLIVGLGAVLGWLGIHQLVSPSDCGGSSGSSGSNSGNSAANQVHAPKKASKQTKADYAWAKRSISQIPGG